MSQFKMSFITGETDSVNNEEVELAFPSITSTRTSVNILCYSLHADYINIHFMANSVIEKDIPNPA